MGFGLSYKYRRCSSSPYAASNSNPNPKRFKVVKSEIVQCANSYCLVIKVHYPDAKNFEGLKIMVYYGFSSVESLLKETHNELDPHFSDYAISPDARFPPTDSGWSMAIQVANLLVGK